MTASVLMGAPSEFSKRGAKKSRRRRRRVQWGIGMGYLTPQPIIGERRKLPSWVRGGAPTENEFGVF